MRAGKIPPSRREHYRLLMKADPEGTTQLLGRLAAGLVPTGEPVGVTEPGTAGQTGDAYLKEWVEKAAPGTVTTDHQAVTVHTVND